MTPPAAATVGNLLEETTERLAAAEVPEARHEAVALLAHALSTDRGGVLARKPDAPSAAVVKTVRALVAARAERRPLQHLIGTAWFHGLAFEVGPEVLIPRPETEGLVDAVLGAGLPEDARVADLGTGSGCIAIALAASRPRFTITVVDRSREALAVACRNAARHGVGARIEPFEGTFTAFGELPQTFDAVVSNPPYVTDAEWLGLQPEVRDHEPQGALVSGPTGLEAYAAIAPAAFTRLRPGGLLALELGWKSEPGVRGIVRGAGFRDVQVAPDLAGIPRVLTARR